MTVLPLLAAAAAALGPGTEVDRELRAFTADAAVGVQAWASWDPASGAYRLKLRRRGDRPRLAGVRPGIEPDHVDVGTDAAGRPVVTYARCPAYGMSCDLYALDPATGTERRLRSSINSRAGDELAPSTHRGRIAFARGGRLYASTLRGISRPQRQPAPRRTRVLGIGATELSAHGLFFTALTPGDIRTERLYRVDGGRARQLDRAVSSGANLADLTKPSIGGPYVHYVRTNSVADAGNRLYRIDLRTGRRSAAGAHPTVRSAAWLGHRFLIAETLFDDSCGDPPPTDRAQSPCRVYETDTLTFTRTRPGARG